MSRRTIIYLQEELKRWPGVKASLDPAHKHPRVVLEKDGKSRFLCFGGSPTTRCGMRNAVAQLRRELRNLGATRAG